MGAYSAQLTSELAAGDTAAGEEEALMSQLAAREAECERLRVEEVERDEQFRTITRDLQEQIASLKAEEREEEMHAHRHTQEHSTLLFSHHQRSPQDSSSFPSILVRS